MPAKEGNQNAKGKHWKLSDKTKQKMSLASKKKWKDSEYREKTCKSISDTLNTPEKKAEVSIRMKEIHSRPDFFLPDLNLFIEIKGYWRGSSKEKSDVFGEQYQQYNYVVWFAKDLERLGINLREVN